MAVGQRGGAGSHGIDHPQFRAVTTRLDYERPQMNVGPMNIRGPGDDEFRMAELLGFGSVTQTDGRSVSGASGGGANGPVEPGGAQAMEKAPVHSGAVQHPHGSGEAIRQDGF